jgi:hypothetical protein
MDLEMGLILQRAPELPIGSEDSDPDEAGFSLELIKRPMT